MSTEESMDIDPSKGQVKKSTARGWQKKSKPAGKAKKNEAWLIKKNIQHEAPRFRREDAKLLQMPTELMCQISVNTIAVPICFYKPLLFCLRVKRHLQSLTHIPVFSDYHFLIAMRALMTAKLVQSHRSGVLCPRQFSGELLNLVPTALIRQVDIKMSTVLKPIRYVIDCIGTFQIMSKNYMPFVLKSKTDAHHAINGVYYDKKWNYDTSMASTAKRATSEAAPGPVIADPRIAALPFPIGEVTLPESLPPSDDPVYNLYFEWSQKLKRFSAVDDVAIMSGVGHPSQLVRTEAIDFATRAWSYTNSGSIDFALSYLGLGEKLDLIRPTLPDCVYSIADTDSTLDEEVRISSALKQYEISVCTT